MESNKRMKIAVLCDWYLPGYKAGGPIQSVANLVARLDHEFHVITSDRDLGESEPYPSIIPNEWNIGKVGEQIIYLSPDQQTQERFESLLSNNNFDAIYLNSMFSTTFSIKPMQAIRKLKLTDRVVLAPRGMLKSGAMSQKGWKKQAFLWVAKTLGWYKNIRWHATNEQEATEIAHFFGRCNIRVAPNLISAKSASFTPTRKEAGLLKITTVARISPEKNILQAIEFLREIKCEGVCIHWEIFGTQNDQEYLALCQAALQNITCAEITLKGEIQHDQIAHKLAENHLFYLPTLGENYGHSIVESFLSGTPVLISDKTPWRGLSDKHAGWDLALDEAGFADIIALCLWMNQEEYIKWAEGAFNLGQQIAEDTDARSANNNLFLPNNGTTEN
jgi:glycosyltransferase involved in cell wall biosynthesis